MKTRCIILLPALCVLSGCFLFRSGHLEIPASARTVYEEGLSLYDESRYAEAEQKFREALEADVRAILPRYRLGLALVQQQKLSDAQGQFQRIIGMARNVPYGYHGFGLVALQRKNRRFDAINWFREALKRDPSFVDAQWQLALTRLAISNGLFGAFAVGDIRQEFQRVIELDPKHPEAYYMLGITYYEYDKFDDAEAAIPFFERQVAVNPEHMEARYQLGLAYIDVERITEGIATLEAIKYLNTDWEEKIAQVIAEARLRNALVPADSIFIVLTALPERERRLYFDLTPVLPPGQAAAMDDMALADAESTAFRYWKSRDPNPSKPDNERLVEHGRRIAYARRYFGRGVWPWDKRGEVYVRYGEPASRRTYTSDTAQGAFGAVAQFGIRQVERWIYETPPLQFEFVDQGSNFAFDLPLPPATGDIAAIAEETLNDPAARIEETAAKTPAVYKTDYEHGPPLRFSYSLAVFRAPDGQPELEVDFAIPASELSFQDNASSLETALMVFDRNWQELTRTVEQHKLAGQSPETPRDAQVALYRRTMRVPAGQRQFTIQLSDLYSQRTGVYRQPLEVDPFDPAHLAMSDIRLVTTVQPASRGAFIRQGRRLLPNPAGVYSRTRLLTLYFEIYNLSKNTEGRTGLTIEYTVFPLSGTSRPGLLIADQTITEGGQRREFALVQEEEGTEETLYRDIAIDMGEAAPGRYVLQVTATDRNRNESITRSAIFQFVK